MAVTQTKADNGMGQIAEKSDGVTKVMGMGAIDFATGTGTPVNGASGTGTMVDAAKGSVYVNVSTGKWYVKTSAADASAVWVIIGTVES